MPSPIAHSVSGYIITRFFPGNYWSRARKQLIFYSVFVAIFADFDFIPQFLTGEQVHRGLTHSLFFSFFFSIIVGFLLSYLWQLPSKRLFFFTFILYSSHLLLDFFTGGGKGIQLFWPLSSFYESPITIFPGIHHSRGLWDASHLFPLSFEAIYAFLLFWLVKQRKTLNKGKSADSGSSIN